MEHYAATQTLELENGQTWLVFSKAFDSKIKAVDYLVSKLEIRASTLYYDGYAYIGDDNYVEVTKCSCDN